MTRNQLIEKVRAAARRLDTKTLKYADFSRTAGISDYWIRKHFDRWAELCAAAGIESARQHRYTDDEVFDAMRGTFEKLGGIGSQNAFARRFGRAMSVLYDRWTTWHGALAAFRDWALVNAPDFKYMAELQARIAKGRDSCGRAVKLPDRNAVARELRRNLGDGAAGRKAAASAGPLVGDVIAYKGILYTRRSTRWAWSRSSPPPRPTSASSSSRSAPRSPTASPASASRQAAGARCASSWSTPAATSAPTTTTPGAASWWCAGTTTGPNARSG
jgi:hypothetical protein